MLGRIKTAEKIRGSKLSRDDILVLINPLQKEVMRAPTLLPAVTIDHSFIETAIRELREETGLVLEKNVAQAARQIHTESVGDGLHVYHRVLFTPDFTDKDLPSLTPEAAEGITQSHWINIDNIHFERHESGHIVSGHITLNGDSHTIKPSDNTAANIAYALSQAGLPGDYPRPDYALAQTGMANHVTLPR